MYKETYTEELRAYFGTDQRRINHALKVLDYAEKIMAGETLDEEKRKIVTITALLHDVGIKIAEEKYGSSAGHYQEIEGPAIVQEMMCRQGEHSELIERVSYIVGGHHTPAKNNGLDFQILWEADLLVNIEEDGAVSQGDNQLKTVIARNFKTFIGIMIAKNKFLKY